MAEKKINQAFISFKDALKCIKDEEIELKALILTSYLDEAQSICDWEIISSKNINELIRVVNKIWDHGSVARINSFRVQALNCPLEFQQAVAAEEAYIAASSEATGFTLQHALRSDKNNRKILKIGYISNDFYQHSVGLLLRDIFKDHDRSKFHITGYYTNKHTDEITHKIKSSCDEFIMLNEYEKPAEKIYNDNIDILVDLSGYTKGSKQEILTLQPAPVQCHWLGFSSSLQMPYIQYFITNEVMVPSYMQRYFSEKVVYLEQAYCATQPFVENLPRVKRIDFAIPEDKFIFCSFVMHYRIDYIQFSNWMTILKQCENSVLWMYGRNEETKSNLRKYAEEQGVAAERLFFLDTFNLTDKWPHQLADLWLDPTNISSTTGVFLSLWAGVPMLTCCGKTPHARQAAALLTAAGYADFVVTTQQDYINKATYLYKNSRELSRIKAEIINSREHNPLFKAEQFIRQLESFFLSIPL